MLKKLFKYEWLGAWKIPLLLLTVLFGGTLALGFSFALPIWDTEWVGFGLSFIGTFLVYYALVIGAPLGITIYLVVRYYKSMFTDEGYLTHTLPATTHQLLISKGLVMGAWNLISSVAVVASVFIILGMVYLFQFSSEVPILELLNETKSLFLQLLEEGEFHGLGSYIICAIILGLTQMFYSIMRMISAISIGQMLRKHRILGAIGSYIGVGIVISIVETIISIPYMLITGNIEKIGALFDVNAGLYLINAVFYVAVGIGLYFLSEYLTRKWLELE